MPLLPRLFPGVYAGAWQAALPLLRRHPRLRRDVQERLHPAPLALASPIWIQAASVGEARLARALARALAQRADKNILCTSLTPQGLDILAGLPEEIGPRCALRVFPFDLPSVMRLALDLWRPAAVVLLETEIWPGLLLEAARKGIPVLVVNGRMTAGSVRGYALLPFLSRIGPTSVLATTDLSAARFRRVFPHAQVRTMPNMKFDLVKIANDRAIPGILPPEHPLAVFGSIRRKEEPDIAATVAALLARRPDILVALFPRHMERVRPWTERLRGLNLTALLRSALAAPPAPGTVIVWDAVGELAAAYAHARAVFVGGSLAPCGGQNFLEPLLAGVRPCIGPSWENFDWAAEALLGHDLVTVVDSGPALTEAMLHSLRRPEERETVRTRTLERIAPFRGGTDQAAYAVLETLSHA